MEFNVDQVPAEARWAMSTKGMIGALVAHKNAIYNMVGKEKYSAIVSQIWTQIGQASAKEAKSFGMTGENAKSAAEAGAMTCMCAMGPELKVEEIEASEDKAVMKITGCPWWNRQCEFGISDDLLSAADSSFWNGFVKEMSPNVTMKHGKQMHRGDPYCEWIFEKK